VISVDQMGPEGLARGSAAKIAAYL